MRFKTLISGIGIVLISGTNIAFAAYTENWEIDNFTAEIRLNSDSSAEVREIIEADFSNEAHRGLERSIPSEYVNDTKIDIDFQNSPDWYNYSYSSNGYQNLQLTTFDDSQIQGPATFDINYTAKNIILFQDDYEEFYWNINGTDWVVPTNQISATVYFPENIQAKDLEFICFSGEYGSQEQNCSAQSTPNSNSVTFSSSTSLKAYEGLSIGIKFPKGTFTKPNIFLENPIIFLPLLILLIMTFLYRKYGRDDQTVPDTIIPHYHAPKGMLVSEVGTLIDERLDPKDISATIIDHAVKGEIEIIEIKKDKLFGEDIDYRFKLKKPYTFEKKYEEIILKRLFPVNKTGHSKLLSELKNKFYSAIPQIEKNLMEQMIADGYFPHKPNNVRAIYFAIGGFIMFLAFTTVEVDTFAFAGLLFSGLIVNAFAYFMPRKSKKGTEAYYQLKGLYEYINTAEKDRLKFQEDNNIIFEKLLPFAMAFGIADKWSKAFEGILKTPPTWFHSHNLNNQFDALYFSRAIGKMSEQMNQNISSRPGGKGGSGAWSGGSSFGGGGFSGGGFGGGGGRGL